MLNLPSPRHVVRVPPGSRRHLSAAIEECVEECSGNPQVEGPEQSPPLIFTTPDSSHNNSNSNSNSNSNTGLNRRASS